MCEESLENLLNLSVYDKVLDSKYLELLNLLLKCPGLTAYDAYQYTKHISINNKKPWYKTKWRFFEYLLKLDLIEVVKEEYIPLEKKGKDRIPYRLSLNGIFYVIINNFDGLYYELVIQLLKNYSSNALFTLFLYPYISQNTLLEIKDDRILYNFSIFKTSVY